MKASESIIAPRIMYENASKPKIAPGTGYSFSGALIDLRSGDLNLNPEQVHGLYDVEFRKNLISTLG